MNTPASISPSPPTVAQAFWYWLKLGFISFGGPAGQIAMMHRDLVEQKRWISEARFLHALNFCMVLPGPEAIQLAMYISWLLHGVAGAVLAGILFFLPAFILLALLAGLYLTWGDVPLVAALFYGIKPAVVALVCFAAWRIGAKTLRSGLLWSIAVMAFVGIFVFAISFPWIVLGAAILGALGGKFVPAQFNPSGGQGAAQQGYGAAVLDDHTPLPVHAQFSWLRLSVTVGVFIAIWSVVMWAIRGQPVLYEMGSFFSKAAFVTIGGAYAVLPYVYQGGVEHYGWLTGTQMMDGLALGEATPGPLIMVVTWVGYLGGVAKAVLGHPVAAGLAGASVATFFTLLPSFLFILAGGPLVESTRGNLKFSAPLSAISAAVVGVILNLALFFAWHTFFPLATTAKPLAAPIDWFAVALAMGALLALWKYRADALWVLGVCAGLGLVYTGVWGLA